MEQNTENDFQVKDPEGLLRAWNQWKEICAVEGIDRESQELLAPVIANAWHRRLEEADVKKRLGGGKGADMEVERIWKDYWWSPEENPLTNQLRVCNAFDGSILLDQNGKRIDYRTHGETKYVPKKAWKEYVWNKVRENCVRGESALKAIHGLLLKARWDEGQKGKGKASAISVFVCDFLMKNSLTYRVNGHQEDGTKTTVVSMEQPIEGNDVGTLTWGEMIPSLQPAELLEIEKKECEDFVNGLPLETVVWLFVKKYKLGNKESLHSLLQLKVSQANAVLAKEEHSLLWKNFLDGKRKDTAQIMRYLEECCLNRLKRPENHAKLFLKDIDEAMKE